MEFLIILASTSQEEIILPCFEKVKHLVALILPCLEAKKPISTDSALYQIVPSTQLSPVPNRPLYQIVPSTKLSLLPNCPLYQIVPSTKSSLLPNRPF